MLDVGRVHKTQMFQYRNLWGQYRNDPGFKVIRTCDLASPKYNVKSRKCKSRSHENQ